MNSTSFSSLGAIDEFRRLQDELKRCTQNFTLLKTTRGHVLVLCAIQRPLGRTSSARQPTSICCPSLVSLLFPLQRTKLNLLPYQQKEGCLFCFTSSEALERKAGYSAYWKQSRSRTSPEANAIMIAFRLAVGAEGVVSLPELPGKGDSAEPVRAPCTLDSHFVSEQICGRDVRGEGQS